LALSGATVNKACKRELGDVDVCLQTESLAEAALAAQAATGSIYAGSFGEGLCVLDLSPASAIASGGAFGRLAIRKIT
jgi:hypothetical protein